MPTHLRHALGRALAQARRDGLVPATHAKASAPMGGPAGVELEPHALLERDHTSSAALALAAAWRRGLESARASAQADHGAHATAHADACARALCFEIKPKCGLPVTDAHCSGMSRYSLHQEYKARRGEVTSRSGYDPLDLFAHAHVVSNTTGSGGGSGGGDEDLAPALAAARARVERALVALLRTPQNNLTVFEGGRRVYGGDKRACAESSTAATVLHAIAHNLVPIEAEREDTHKSADAPLSAGTSAEADGRSGLSIDGGTRAAAPACEPTHALASMLCDILMREPHLCALLDLQRGGRSGTSAGCGGGAAARAHAHAQAIDAHAGANGADARAGSHALASAANELHDFLVAHSANDCGLMVSVARVQAGAEHAPSTAAALESGGHVRVLRQASGALLAYAVAFVDLDAKPARNLPRAAALEAALGLGPLG